MHGTGRVKTEYSKIPKLVKKYLKEIYKKNCFVSCRVRVMLKTLINV